MNLFYRVFRIYSNHMLIQCTFCLQKASEYDQEMLQSQTTVQPTVHVIK